MTRNSIRMLRIGLWSLVALAALGFVWIGLRPQPMDQREMFSTLGQGEYSLVTADGQPFTQADLVGAPSAVFFGFTHCPDVCPTTLGEIMAWQEDLEAEGETLRTFFITVDPERDTRDVLGDYVSWVPGVTGVTGEPEEVQKAIKAFRVFAQKVEQDGGEYTMNHSSQVLLFDDQGQFFAPIGYQQDHERSMQTLRDLMAS
ncbi:SCO family protein [Paracoccus sp. TK19116]|uniref:SCO family protein n=1 Tax=Paracoccus albicereus TaxID=2922394 RepID=A0ABT1MUG5_9RHOB|nr:SCO family protein [Paracoccus albicereus]MCQ0971329.1 SCO family protein [Paracoccus albicereus]